MTLVPDDHVVVLFGATGDLARRKLGDRTLFTRADEVNEQWQLVDAIVAAWRPLSMPSPPASKPTMRTSGSSTKPAKSPIAFEPPPTHATTASGNRPTRPSICSRASRPMTDCSSATSSGYGAGPTHEPIR